MTPVDTQWHNDCVSGALHWSSDVTSSCSVNNTLMLYHNLFCLIYLAHHLSTLPQYYHWGPSSQRLNKLNQLDGRLTIVMNSALNVLGLTLACLYTYMQATLLHFPIPWPGCSGTEVPLRRNVSPLNSDHPVALRTRIIRTTPRGPIVDLVST